VASREYKSLIDLEHVKRIRHILSLSIGIVLLVALCCRCSIADGLPATDFASGATADFVGTASNVQTTNPFSLADFTDDPFAGPVPALGPYAVKAHVMGSGLSTITVDAIAAPTITLTVTGSGVTTSGVTQPTAQPGVPTPTNWAVLMNSTTSSVPVTVTASISPDTPANEAALTWSGGTVVTGNLLAVTVPITASAKIPVTATLRTSSATVNIWVVSCAVNIIMRGATTDYPGAKPFKTTFADGTQLLACIIHEHSSGLVIRRAG